MMFPIFGKSLAPTLLILFALFAFVKPLHADQTCTGPGCGGGGGANNGVTNDTYMAQHQADLAALKVTIEPYLTVLRQKAPDFTAELEHGFSYLSWYKVDDAVLEKLGKALDNNGLVASGGMSPSGISCDKGLHQAAYQTSAGQVLLAKDCFDTLGQNAGEQAKLILHELVRRIVMAQAGTTTALTENSLLQAVDALFDAKNLTPEALEKKLQELGFRTHNISDITPLQKLRAQNSSEKKPPLITDPVPIEVELKHPITIYQARLVVDRCLMGGPAIPSGNDGSSYLNGTFDKDSLLGALQQANMGNPAQYPDTDQGKDDNVQQSYNGESRFLPAELDPSLLPEHALVTFMATGSQQNPYKMRSNALISAQAKDQEIDLNKDQVVDDQNLINRYVTLIPEGGMPVLQYQADPDEHIFDDWGLTNTARHLNHITIVANRNWVDGNGTVELHHSVTGVTIGLKIDGKKYLHCLKDGFETVPADPTLAPELGPKVIATQVPAKDPPAAVRATTDPTGSLIPGP